MKKEVSPVVVGIIIVIVLVALGAAFYRQAVYNPPSAHPQLFGGSGNGPARGAAGGPGGAAAPAAR